MLLFFQESLHFRLMIFVFFSKSSPISPNHFGVNFKHIIELIISKNQMESRQVENKFSKKFKIKYYMYFSKKYKNRFKIFQMSKYSFILENIHVKLF